MAAALRARGYPTLDLTDDEMAKVHVRHLVGGTRDGHRRAALPLEFPERPGALMEFLEKLGGRLNITLFHYRNHGADFGRVLAAFAAPESDLGELKTFLDHLGYPAVFEGKTRPTRCSWPEAAPNRVERYRDGEIPDLSSSQGGRRLFHAYRESS